MSKKQAIKILRSGGFSVHEDQYPTVVHQFDRQPEVREQEALQILCRDYGFDYLEPVNLD